MIYIVFDNISFDIIYVMNDLVLEYSDRLLEINMLMKCNLSNKIIQTLVNY